LRGYGRVIIGTGETGMGTGDPNDTRPFICEEGAATGEAVIYISAPGHTPAATAISIPNDTQETVEFMLGKSCTGGQSCYDVTRIRARGDAAREAGMLAMLNGTLSRRFPDDKYVLQCVECDLGRGGFVKLQGAYANGTRFTYYHRFGWCSSGGTDCKDTECFATYTTKVPSSAAAECLQK
jgi:hypothetical protein